MGRDPLENSRQDEDRTEEPAEGQNPGGAEEQAERSSEAAGEGSPRSGEGSGTTGDRGKDQAAGKVTPRTLAEQARRRRQSGQRST